MKKKFIENTLNKIKLNKDITDLEEKRLRYGLEGFYNLFTKIVVLFLLALIFNLLLELVLLIFIYSLFRLYGFGIHAKKSWQCWLSTVPIYIGGCFIIKYATFSQSFAIVVWILGFMSFLLFAPADTASRPLIHKNKRIRAKVLSLVIWLGFLIINLVYDNQLFSNATLYALLMETIAINPLTYKLFNASYNNYKSYQKNMV